ncbi:zinc finger CCCH domain-containing protein 11A-like [Asbolus verrucosus]|uniref:Zinc finger CCCH domain-containing protein 11A-like n=1 Tax=Asbolus verrucosus TaxID=1661398 RepID=A0A482VXP9_ASBVE|nr:zinc finger CCCH domain-containing protein 11A-like [Asbolus verrucosus]
MFVFSPDNFFKKMTDLESPRKNNDCYFYYYSTCAKGDNCTFRHEPSALGCETMCSFWKEGKCLNVHCNFRHMELRKNRKAIPCYWESQPGGCLKPHCPFLHQNAKPTTADESHDSKTDSGTESADNTMNEKLSHMSEKSFKNAPVDSLVVNFEEESDNESAPTNSPIKSSHRVVKVKTLEEIKLEKIQAESAAYYSYPENEKTLHDADDLRQRIWERISSKNISTRKADNPAFAKKRALESLNILGPLTKKQKRNAADIVDIKIKTLDEIRAERAKKIDQNREVDNPDKIAQPYEHTENSPAICDSLVTSTEDILQEKINKLKPKKIKLQRKFLEVQEKSDKPHPEIAEEVTGQDDALNDEKVCDSEQDVEMNESDSNKLDEVLLLQDDDDNCNVSLKDEERLLNDFDDLLED